MFNRKDTIKGIKELISDVEKPLVESEIGNGWCVECQSAMLKILRDLERGLGDGIEIEPVNLGRGLDFWGVDKGVLFERFCELSNQIREIHDQ